MNTSSRTRRRIRIRARLSGTALRPRASVFRSLHTVSVQVIDDEAGRTLVALHGKSKKGVTKMEQAKQAGLEVGAMAKAAGITRIVFDRGGYKYEGRVRAVAEGMREAGLDF